MEEFRIKYVRACHECNVTPSDAIISALHDRRNGTLSLHEDQDEDLGGILDLSGCNLTIADCSVLAKCLMTSTLFHDLRFTDCLLTEEACKFLLNALCFNQRILKVDFKGNNVRSSGAELVGKLLKRTTVLTHLRLEWNALGMWDSGMSALAEGLALNHTLKYLDLRNNQISHEGAVELANAVKRNKTLKIFDLRWNNIGIIGAKAFLAAINHNNALTKLELSGNNIPTEMLKALESALLRNADRQAVKEEQEVMSKTLKQELQLLEKEKKIQVSSLVDQLAREKDLHVNFSQSALEKINQLKEALEDRKAAFTALEAKYSSCEATLRLAGQNNKELQENISQLKEDRKKAIKDHEEALKILREQHDLMEKSHRSAAEVAQSKIRELEKKNRELEDEVRANSEQIEVLNRNIRKNDFSQQERLREAEENYCKEIERLRSTHDEQKRLHFERIQKLEGDKQKLEEDVSRLKSDLITEKLRAEEEMMNLKTKLKQEELNKCKQYDERIDLLQLSRDELQTKVTKQNVEITELQGASSNSSRENESLKRQIQQLKQQLDLKENELRNEVSKSRLELDTERRTQNELKDKISNLESLNAELNKKLRDLTANKDQEILRLQTQLQNKDAEMSRMKDEEIRRAGILESALQSYIASAKSPYRS